MSSPPPPYQEYEPFPIPPDDDSVQQRSGELVGRDKPKKQRRTRVVLINVLNVIALVSVVLTGLASLATFSAKENEIRAKTVYDDDEKGFCILFAKYTSGQLLLGTSQACHFVTYGEAFACLFAAAVIPFAVVRIWMGKWYDAISGCGGYWINELNLPRAGSRVCWFLTSYSSQLLLFPHSALEQCCLWVSVGPALQSHRPLKDTGKKNFVALIWLPYWQVYHTFVSRKFLLNKHYWWCCFLYFIACCGGEPK